MHYQCLEGDFETKSERAAIHHCNLTGHTVVTYTKNGLIATKIKLLKD